MIRIEIKKIIKDGTIIILVLFLLLFAMIMTDKESYIAPALEIFLLLYACFSGWSMFERERQEGAIEYLLSMPVSRTKLFFIKFIVRVVFILVVLVLYYLVYQRYRIHFLLPVLSFILLFFTVFILSLSLSLSMKSFLSTFFITLFLSIGLYQFIELMDFSKIESHIAIQTVLSYLIIPILFILFFHKYDIKPISYFNKVYIPSVIFIIFLIFGITYLTTHISWWHCYLNDEGHIFRVSRKKTVIIEQNGKKQISKLSLTPLFQKDKKMYASLWKGNNQPRQLIRLDLKSGEIEIILTLEPKYRFHNFIDTRATIGDRIFFLLTRDGHKKYKILEVGENQHRIIPVRGDFGDEYFHMICGVVEDPLQFIVMTLSRLNHSTGSKVYRIFETGKVELLFSAEAIAFWKDKLLRFTGQGLILYETGPQFNEILHKKGNYKKVRRKYENYIQQKVMLRLKNDFFVFDMQDQTMEKLNIQKLPYYYITTKDDNLRLVWTNGPEISISTWKNNHLQVEKIWYTGIEGLKIIRVFSSGVLVYNRNEYEAFLFEEGEEEVL